MATRERFFMCSPMACYHFGKLFDVILALYELLISLRVFKHAARLILAFFNALSLCYPFYLIDCETVECHRFQHAPCLRFRISGRLAPADGQQALLVSAA